MTSLDWALNALTRDASLGGLLAVPLEGVVMPAAGGTHHEYLAVNVVLRDVVVSLTTISRACGAIVKYLQQHGFLTGMLGVNLLVCSLTDHDISRILRLSLLEESLARAQELAPTDLLAEEPFPGARCYRYMTHIAV